MKFLFLTSFFTPINGGSAVVYKNICNFNPDESVVLTAKKDYNNGKKIDGIDIHDANTCYPIYRLNFLRPPTLPKRNIFRKALDLIKFDLFISLKVFIYTLFIIKKYNVSTVCIGDLHSLSWVPHAINKLLIEKVKVVNYIHGEEVTSNYPYKRFGQKGKKYLQKADKILVVSQFTENYLTQYWYIDKDKIYLLPNGVDISYFTPSKTITSNIDRYIFSVGRLIERKGFDNAIKAFSIISQSHPALKYYIAGTGPEKENLEKIINENNLFGKVFLLERVSDSDVLRYYQNCIFFIMPNRTLKSGDTEGFGLVFLEANACGKPVIGGNAGGAVNAIIDGKTGYLVDSTNVDDIAEKMLLLLCDENIYYQMCIHALAHAHNNSFQNLASKFKHILSTN